MGIVAVLFLLSPLSSKSNGSIKSIVGFGAVFIFIQTFQIFLMYRALLNSEFFIDEDKISHKTVKIEKSLDIKSLSSVEIAKTNITILNIKKVLRFSSGLDKIEVFLEDYGITEDEALEIVKYCKKN